MSDQDKKKLEAEEYQKQVQAEQEKMQEARKEFDKSKKKG